MFKPFAFAESRPARRALVQPMRREDLETWERWVPNALELDAPAPTQEKALKEPEPSEPESQLQARIQAELEQLRKETIEAARAEGLELGRAAGHEEGCAQGYEEGLAQGRAEAQEHAEAALAIELQSVRHLVTNTAEAIQGLASTVSPSLTRLALAIARQVVSHELQVQASHVQGIIENLLHTVFVDHREVRLSLHPEDIDRLGPALTDTLKERGWEIVPDTSLLPGGCIARSAYGELDATVQTRWQKVCEALGESLSWDPSEEQSS